MAHVQRCTYGRWTFWRKARVAPVPDEAPLVGLVSASAFTFAAAYRDSGKYARGVLGLVDAVRLHLPGFRLRLYCDSSIDPYTLRQGGDHKAAALWEDALAYCEGAPHVDLVWFQHSAFVSPDGVGHVELFGCFARFLPLFECPDRGLPSGPRGPSTGAAWWASPPPGVLVASSDIDFGDYATEHAMLHGLQWLSSSEDGTGVGGDTLPRPSVWGVAAAGSAAARHSPNTRLPPTYSGLIANRVRWPSAWLDRFLEDAGGHRATGTSCLLQRYLLAVHDPSRRNAAYSKRRIGEQALLPFGVDEWFLTNVVKPLCIASPTVCTWMFVVIPPVDMEVSKMLRMVEGALRGAGGARRAIGTEPPFQALLHGLAVAAGEEDSLRACRGEWSASPSPQAYDAVAAQDIAAWRGSWGAAAAGRVSLWSRFQEHDTFTMLHPSRAHPVAAGLRVALSAFVEAMSLGLVEHSDEDMEQALQNLAYFSSVAPSLASPLCFTVGQGNVTPLPLDNEHSMSMVGDLVGSVACGIPRTEARVVHAAVAAAGGRGAYLSAIRAAAQQ